MRWFIGLTYVGEVLLLTSYGLLVAFAVLEKPCFDAATSSETINTYTPMTTYTVTQTVTQTEIVRPKYTHTITQTEECETWAVDDEPEPQPTVTYTVTAQVDDYEPQAQPTVTYTVTQTQVPITSTVTLTKTATQTVTQTQTKTATETRQQKATPSPYTVTTTLTATDTETTTITDTMCSTDDAFTEITTETRTDYEFETDTDVCEPVTQTQTTTITQTQTTTKTETATQTQTATECQATETDEPEPCSVTETTTVTVTHPSRAHTHTRTRTRYGTKTETDTTTHPSRSRILHKETKTDTVTATHPSRTHNVTKTNTATATHPPRTHNDTANHPQGKEVHDGHGHSQVVRLDPAFKIANKAWSNQPNGPEKTRVTNEDVVLLDGFETTANQVKSYTRSANGRRVIPIAYLSAGSFERWRSDAAAWPKECIGKEYEGWPGENWLAVQNWKLIRPVMLARLRMVKGKGFAGIEVDNIALLDQFDDDEDAKQQYKPYVLQYAKWLADTAHRLGLAIIFKNGGELAQFAAEHYDGVIAESPLQYNELNLYKPFFDKHKPVWVFEYSSNHKALLEALKKNPQLKVSDAQLDSKNGWTHIV